MTIATKLINVTIVICPNFKVSSIIKYINLRFAQSSDLSRSLKISVLGSMASSSRFSFKPKLLLKVRMIRIT